MKKQDKLEGFLLVFTLLFYLNSFANLDNQNATYIAWEGCPSITQDYGQLHLFTIFPNTTVTVYTSDAAGNIIQNATAITSYSLPNAGQPIDWISTAGSPFDQKYFKITSNYPVIAQVQSKITFENTDFETTLISTNGNYKGNNFYTYMQYMTDYDSTLYGSVITIFNPDSVTKTVTVARWGGNSYNVSPSTFSVPPDGVYIYGGTDSSTTGYYNINCSNGNILVMEGNSQTSDDNNWFEYGMDWHSGGKIGDLIYGKYGPMNNKLIITGISGSPSYQVFTMPYPAMMSSNNTWTLYTSSSVAIGAANVIDPPSLGTFKVIVTGGTVHVGSGSQFLEVNVSDGDYVPGTNTNNPFDTDFYFSSGPQNYIYNTGITASVICPTSGTSVNLSPASGTISGVNPTTAEDMAVVWDSLPVSTTFHVTSNNPVYCFIQGPCCGERAMSMSSLLVAAAVVSTPTATITIITTTTQTPTFTLTAIVSPIFSFTWTPTNTITPIVSPSSTPTIISECLELYKNSPNPFVTGTNIIYELCNQTKVEVKIYTISGEVVVELAQQGQAGINTIYWDAENKSGKGVASGIYIYSIKSLNNKEKKWGKMAVVK